MSFEETIPNERLKRARYEQGWTQAELAEKVGTTFETVSRWERGTKAPSAYYRRKLCDVLGKSAEELGLLVTPDAPLASGPSPCIFLSSAYNDAELKFVTTLRKELQARGITVWSSRTVRRQETRNKRNVLQEAIRAAQVVLLIASPRAPASHHVHDTLRLARHFRHPVCVAWVEGKKLAECIPQNYGEPYATIDARQGDEQVLCGKIITSLEQAWLAPGSPETIGLPEIEWKAPTRLTPLIDREEESARLRALLSDQQTRLVTLLGPGGIGKTRLSLQAAIEMREQFTDGVCFVPLAPVSDPELVIPAIAKALGVREVGEHTLFELVKLVLKDRHLLLLLDNFEQVQNAAPQLSALLAACPRLKILVTGRARLRLRDEYGLPIPPLPLPDLSQPLGSDSLAQNPSVALFTQRAQLARPDFRLASTNAPAVAEICVRLDGLPLAIELAAARVRSLASQALLERLTARPLDVVTSNDQDVDNRQRTLRNTIAWSYDLLNSAEQQLFRRLSVFAGGWSLETVEVLYEALGDTASHVWDGVDSLLDKSLVQTAEQEGEGRLRLLETIREYGLELLHASGEAQAVRQAHAGYYLALVEQAEPHLKDEQQIVWLTRLEQEQANLSAALQWLIERREAAPALRFCGALWWYWRMRGYWSEGRRWLGTALGLAQSGEPTLARARVLCAAGDLAYFQDDNPAARPLLEESIELCRALGAEKELAVALGMLGEVLRMEGNLIEAAPLLKESEALLRALGSNWELSYLLRRLAQHAAHMGELSRAVMYAQESLTLARRLGDKSLMATILSTLGDIVARQDNLAQAIAYNRESLALARELGDKLLIALALNNLAFFSALQDDLTLAAYAQEGYALMRELGDRMYIARCLHTVGYITMRQGNLVQATLWHREALLLARESQNEVLIGENLAGLARIALAEGQFLQAARLFGAAEARFDVNVDIYPADQAEYKRAVERARVQSGAKAFAKARNEGRALPLEQLLAGSSLPESGPPATPPPSPKYPDGLTEREVQVLCLVAEGLTDEQIARQLVIAPRTVNTHLTSIYRKIRVSSDGGERQFAPRIAAARYVIAHDLC